MYTTDRCEHVERTHQRRQRVKMLEALTTPKSEGTRRRYGVTGAHGELEPWREATGKGDAASARTVVPKDRGSREETPDLSLFLPAGLLNMPPIGT